jgi:hypothetical protein
MPEEDVGLRQRGAKKKKKKLKGVSDSSDTEPAGNCIVYLVALRGVLLTVVISDCASHARCVSLSLMRTHTRTHTHIVARIYSQ